MEHEETRSQAHEMGYKTYFYVWIALMVLLAVTIYVAVAGLPGLSVPVNLLIASIKAFLVLLFFMHLKSEGIFLKLTLFLTILALTLIILLTYADTWYRDLPARSQSGSQAGEEQSPGHRH